MRKQIVTAGTKTGKWEEKYVLDAVRHLGDPDKYDYYLREFEEIFAAYVGAKYALATVNGTSALHLGLLALGIGPGDEVILPDITFVSCANMIRATGAKPIFVEIDPETWCIDPDAVKAAITRRTRAIMPVWMYGMAPDMDSLLKFDIPLIEDACPAVGSFYNDKHAGTFGHVGCFSFQGAKLLAIGEGGMLVTDDSYIYDRAKLYGSSYWTKEFWSGDYGFEYGMNNVSAAVGLGQLEHLDELLEKKKLIAKWYREGLSELFAAGLINFQQYDPNIKPNNWMFSILTGDPETRMALRAFLKKDMIDTRPVFYPITAFPMYHDPDGFDHRQNAYNIGFSGINLPSTVNLSKSEADYVISKIKAYYQKNS